MYQVAHIAVFYANLLVAMNDRRHASGADAARYMLRHNEALLTKVECR